MTLTIIAADLRFTARLERALAPRTCEVFEAMLPFENSLIQARWSGESAWAPLGEFDVTLPSENAKTIAAPGQLLFYPGGISEVELLVPYGKTSFACKDGPLAGNHFLTITDGIEQLAEMGRRVLWEGAQTIIIRRQ